VSVTQGGEHDGGGVAEKSPVWSSAVRRHEGAEKNPMLHHKVREFDTQAKVFKQLTSPRPC